MSTPIAVIIPCRNAAPFLAEALASVAAQTRSAHEVVVIDDASTDGSADIARAAGVQVIRSETPLGNAEARNVGLRATTSPLIAFLDADDVWLPPHLATLAALLEQWPDAGAAFATCEVFGSGTGLHRGFLAEGPPQDAFENCLRWWVGQPTGCMVRRSTLDRAGGFDPTYPVGVDFDCWLRLAREAPFVATHAVTARYRRHPGQVSGDGRRQTAMCWRARYAMRDRLIAEGDPRAARVSDVLAEWWEASCRRAWDAGDQDSVRFLVSIPPRWATDRPAVPQWQARARIPAWCVRLWHRSGLGVTWQRLRQ
ncbi:MAG: glycosyltransferase family A protein [Gemmatimonadaceae bacterium]|nr:glycosyltransferase family A protein [Gemmatimonadaceae bacterium]